MCVCACGAESYREPTVVQLVIMTCHVWITAVSASLFFSFYNLKMTCTADEA